VLTDLKMPGMSGEDFIRRSQQDRPDVPIIVVTAFGSIRSAIECIQAGAIDYLCKPFEPEDLQVTVQNALRLHDLLQENRQLHAVVSTAQSGQRLIGASPAMQRLREDIERVAPYKTNVLITGESGTGKEAVARLIHELGPRNERPWVAINCAAIPEISSKASCSVMSKGPSQAPCRAAWAAWNRRTAAPCFWMRSAI